MGNVFKSVYEVYPELYQWKKVFDHLGLTKQHIKSLHKEFRFIDVDKSNSISLTELVAHLEMEEKAYSKRVFGIFDHDGTGQIDFGEFVAALWNYCTLDKEDLAAFTLAIYDQNGTGELDASELEHILSDVYGKKYKEHKNAKALTGITKPRRQSYDALAFNDFMAKHSALLFPSFVAQNKLRTKIIGIHFWDRLMKERQKDKEHYSLDKLNDMMDKCRAKHRRKTQPTEEVVYVSKAKKKLRPKDDDALMQKPKPKFNLDIENLPRNGSIGTPTTERPSTYREDDMSLPTEAGRRGARVTARRYSAPQVMPY